MPTKADEEAQDLYRSIMEEVMVRIYSIKTATEIPTMIPQPLVREYCYLQLRMLCELTALGCLVAHGDITKSKYFQKAYKADQILQSLEKLHPDFFPSPFKPTFSPPSEAKPKGGLHLDKVDIECLTKDEVVKLYAKCGSILHKGSLRRLLKIKMTSEPNPYRDVIAATQKLMNLLTAHKISRVGNRFHFLTFLSMAAPGSNVAKVEVAIAESPPENAA